MKKLYLVFVFTFLLLSSVPCLAGQKERRTGMGSNTRSCIEETQARSFYGYGGSEFRADYHQSSRLCFFQGYDLRDWDSPLKCAISLSNYWPGSALYFKVGPRLGKIDKKLLTTEAMQFNRKNGCSYSFWKEGDQFAFGRTCNAYPIVGVHPVPFLTIEDVMDLCRGAPTGDGRFNCIVRRLFDPDRDVTFDELGLLRDVAQVCYQEFPPDLVSF